VSETQVEQLGPSAVDELKKYFASSTEDLGKRADVALKVLGRINGDKSNQIKLLALQFQIARAMGLKGEPLRPILAALNPALASGVAAQQIEAAPEAA
jgi:hypothetical protein